MSEWQFFLRGAFWVLVYAGILSALVVMLLSFTKP